MITITARCSDCAWRWKPRKAEGPSLDLVRARKAANVHSRANPGHTVTSKLEAKIEAGYAALSKELTDVRAEVQRLKAQRRDLASAVLPSHRNGGFFNPLQAFDTRALAESILEGREP